MSDLTTGYTWTNGSTVTASRLNTAIEDSTLAPPAISGKTAKTTAVDADAILIWDSADSLLKRMTRANLLGLLNADTVHGQTAKTSLVDADEFMIWDSAASALKKITRANLITAVQPAGTILQVVSVPYTASTNITGGYTVGSGVSIYTANFGSTDGVQIWSQAFTPVSATSKVRVDVMLMAYGTNNFNLVCGVFKDAATTAFWAGVNGNAAGASGTGTLMYSCVDSPGAAVTYKVRLSENVSRVWLNSNSSNPLFGGNSACYLTLTEIKV